MSDNPYEILGVDAKASSDEIRKAYRRLAKKHHPDLNPGDKVAEETFKRVSAAHDLLGDPEKRARYDRGEIDAAGMERPQERYYRDFAGAGNERYSSDAGFADFAADDIIADLFGRRAGRRTFRMPGRDLHFRLSVDFLDALRGTTARVTLPEGGTLDVRIPAGTRDGQVLRLRGKGEPGMGGGPPGDALVEISVKPHRFFTRDGDDIRLTLPISLTEAVLGGRVEVPTPTGRVMMSVPKGASSGRVLRLRGKGAPRADGSSGDLYVTLSIALPAHDPDLEAFTEAWEAGRMYDPRKGLEA